MPATEPTTTAPATPSSVVIPVAGRSDPPLQRPFHASGDWNDGRASPSWACSVTWSMITELHRRPAGTRQRHSSGQVARGHVSARRCRQPRLDRLRRHGCADASLGSRGCGIIGDVDLIARLRVMNPIPPPPTSPHETRATGFLRPAVFGGSDGLVSNLALVMGVAGASVGQPGHRHRGHRGPAGGRLLHGRRRVHLRAVAARALRCPAAAPGGAAARSTSPASAPSWRASTRGAASTRRKREPSWVRSSRRRNARSTR